MEAQPGTSLGQAIRPIALIYVLAGAAPLIGVYLYRGRLLWSHPSPWAGSEASLSLGLSCALGVVFALFVIALTRVAVPRFAWARSLHDALRPITRDLSTPQIVVLALCSGVAEEVIFRGWLQPVLGIWATSLLFGLVHQLPGPGRWVWVVWATIAGLALGAIFELTGHLQGAMLAHVLINGVNLRYLRDFDPENGRQEAA